MTVFFTPDGSLNIAVDASDLPEVEGKSGALTRCKNLRTNEGGKAITRDGSTKLNTSAINAAIWWIEEQAGKRFAFAGTQIYEDEVSIATGLNDAQWAAIKYNAFNDTTDNIFALNGTDRKRIESSSVKEWGIAAPTVAPTLFNGQGVGLTGLYNVKYTYIRKVGSVIVAESNPSPSADEYEDVNDQSLAVDITSSADTQVTHVRLYRTLKDGITYYADQTIPATKYTHGVSQTWKDTDNYISGDAYKFTIPDSAHSSENTYTWEERPDILSDDGGGYSEGTNWWDDDDASAEDLLNIIEGTGGLARRIR